VREEREIREGRRGGEGMKYRSGGGLGTEGTGCRVRNVWGSGGGRKGKGAW